MLLSPPSHVWQNSNSRSRSDKPGGKPTANHIQLNHTLAKSPMIFSAPLKQFLFTAITALTLLIASETTATTVRLQTSLGPIDVVLFDAAAPITVANFLSYVNSGAYNGTFIHRSVPGFVIQGGGYTYSDSTGPAHIAANAPIKNEFSASRSNLRGTIAMAKLGTGPDTATSEWFINLADNASNLDNQNGGFTVFGQVTGNGMAIVDALAALPLFNVGSPFDSLPLLAPPTGQFILKSDLVSVNKMSRLPAIGVNLDGNNKNQLLVRSTSTAAVPNTLQTGRLINSSFQFTPQADPGPNFRLIGVADFDGTGTSDLAFQNTTQGDKGDVVFWPDFQSNKERIVRQVKTVWDVQAAGDLDGDGIADLVWRYMAPDPRDTGVSYIWFTHKTDLPQVRKRGGAPLNWTLLGAADLNSDGAADMIYISPEGAIRALMATANRTCANFSAGNIPAGFTALKLADFTGRARGEMLLRNLATGETRLISLNANGLTLPPPQADPNDPNATCSASNLVVAATTILLPATDAAWVFYAAGDFNGDGFNDIAWLRPDGTITLWLMNANGVNGVSGVGGLTPTVINNAGTAPAGYSPVQP